MAAQLVLAVIYAIPILTAVRPGYSDFLSFYTGGAIVRDGKGERLYNLELQSEYQAEILGPGSRASHNPLLPFINPPHAVLIFFPLTYLSPKAAASVYLSLNCLMAVWILRRLWMLAATWSHTERVLLITTTLAAEPLWYGLGTGTLTNLALLCLIEYFFAIRAGREISAAVWLVAGTIKPQLILFPALIPFVQSRWRLVGVTIALALFLCLSISLTFGFHIWLDYFQLLRQVGERGELYGAAPPRMINLRMVLYWLAPPFVVIRVVYAALLAGVVVVFWIWRAAGNFDLRFGLTVLIGLFLAPHLNYQDALLAILPAVLAYDFAQRHQRLIPVFQVLILMLTFLPPTLILIGYFRIPQWIWPLPLIVCLGAICATFLMQARERRGDHSAHL
jgi:hypothetical protein